MLALLLLNPFCGGFGFLCGSSGRDLRFNQSLCRFHRCSGFLLNLLERVCRRLREGQNSLSLVEVGQQVVVAEVDLLSISSVITPLLLVQLVGSATEEAWLSDGRSSSVGALGHLCSPVGTG